MLAPSTAMVISSHGRAVPRRCRRNISGSMLRLLNDPISQEIVRECTTGIPDILQSGRIGLLTYPRPACIVGRRAGPGSVPSVRATRPMATWETFVTDSMATVIAKKFIQRRDAKARQKDNGDYAPVADWNPDGTRGDLHPWKMSDIEEHLAGTQTYGHYLVDTADQCKLFAFDIDLRTNKPEN